MVQKIINWLHVSIIHIGYIYAEYTHLPIRSFELCQQAMRHIFFEVHGRALKVQDLYKYFNLVKKSLW